MNTHEQLLLSVGSDKTVTLVCRKCGVQRTIPVYNKLIKKNDGKYEPVPCPSCNGKRVYSNANSVAALFPDIARIWSPNNPKPADKYMVSSSEYGKVICAKCGGEYGGIISDLVAGKVTCGICEGRMARNGVNSLKQKYPEIAHYWSNTNSLKSDEVLFSSTHYYDWKCPSCERSFRARIIDVLNLFRDSHEPCPFCDGREAIPGINSYKTNNPDLMLEWDWEANKDICDPDLILDVVVQKVTWKCPKDARHVYHMSPHQRLEYKNSNKIACPFCDNRRALPGVTSFKAKHHDLLKEWIWHLNDTIADPDKILDSYTGKVWWQCQKDIRHKYDMSVYDRINYNEEGKEACPFCTNKKALPGVNSFMALHSDLMDEWDYVSNYAIGVDPDQITDCFTPQVWWNCPHNESHHYSMRISRKLLYRKREIIRRM